MGPSDTPSSAPADYSIRSPILARLLSSEVILLGIATFFGYTVVYAYELAYCTYYGIPLNLIVLNLSTGLGVAAVLIALVYSYAFLYPLWGFWLIRTDQEFRFWGNLCGTWAFSAFILFRAGFNSVVIVASFVLLTFTVKLTRRWWANRSVSVQLTRPAPTDLNTMMWLRLPPKFHFAIGVMALIVAIAYAYGRYSASTDPQYLAAVNARTYIILQIYGDYMIAAPATTKVEMIAGSPFNTVTVGAGLRIFRIAAREGVADLTPRGFGALITPMRAAHRGFWGWLTEYSAITNQ